MQREIKPKKQEARREKESRKLKLVPAPREVKGWAASAKRGRSKS